jgi:hypothetical protein
MTESFRKPVLANWEEARIAELLRRQIINVRAGEGRSARDELMRDAAGLGSHAMTYLKHRLDEVESDHKPQLAAA